MSIQRTIGDLYEAQFNPMVQFAQSKGLSRDDALDVVQDVFTVFLEKYEETGVPEGLGEGYLFQAVKNRCVNLAKSHGFEDALYEEYDEEADPLTLPSKEYYDVEQRVLVQEITQAYKSVLAELPPKCQEATRLRVNEGLSVVEVGQRMGVSKQTAHSHVQKGLKALSEHFRSLGLLEPGWLA